MTQEALKLALEALESAVRYHGIMLMSDPPQDAWKYHRVENKAIKAITAIKEALAQTQEPVAWRCLIASADFSENTITLAMQCEDYKVSAGTHWLSTAPPQRTWVGSGDLEDSNAYLTTPQRTEQEPVGHRDGYWCADLTCKKCYSADFRFKHKNSVDKESLTTPPQRTEQNFCSRCGKRTADLTAIHTCTPPQENT